jgi:hypothetical protein
VEGGRYLHSGARSKDDLAVIRRGIDAGLNRCGIVGCVISCHVAVRCRRDFPDRLAEDRQRERGKNDEYSHVI